jgi:putative ABC transport system permease protein
METLGEWARRILYLFHRNRFNSEMEEEMRFHLERRAEENRNRGMAAEEAGFAAHRRFGNATLLRERSREAWGWSAVDHLLQDLRFALRSLRRNPLFATVIVLTLAFGIGVNTAIFSAVHALLLNPYPFPQSERIVSVEARHVSGTNSNTGYRDFLDWQQQSTAFDAMAITPWSGEYTLTGQGEAQRINGGATTADFLHVLGIQPALGRFFNTQDDTPNAPPVAVLSYEAWRERFGKDPAVLGRGMTLDGRTYTVIGVLPRGFAFPGIESCEFFTSLQESPANSRKQHQYGVVARLKPGVSVTQAQSEMSTIARRLEQEYPATNTGWGVKVVPLRAALAKVIRTPVLLLTAVVGFVLLLACINVSGLVLARASGQTREVAIRAALGAGRGRILRQMLTETVLLSLLGGAAGVLVALALMHVLRAAAPQELALDTALRLNPAVLLFTLALSILTGIVAGFVPAWHGSGASPNAVLKDNGGAWSRARSRNRLLFCLIAGEVALSVILLASAGLLVKSFIRTMQIDTGLRAEHVLTFEMDLPRTKYSTPEETSSFYQTLLDRLGHAPGVSGAAAVGTLPMTGSLTGGAFQVEGRAKAADWVDTMVEYNKSTPGYFQTVGIPLLRGRDFNAQDTATSLPVGIVNETLARQYFPGQDPIGQRYRDDYDGQWRTIVGVVASVKHQQPTQPPMAGLYCPHAQSPSLWMWVTVRAQGDAAQLSATTRAAVHDLDGDLPLLELRTMREVISDSLSEPRLLMRFLTGFALFALLLDAIGIYGLVEYSARQRTHEIGIRMALGASRAKVAAEILRRGLVPAATGAALGLPVALATSGVLRALLYGISPRDFAVFTGVPALLLLVALAASLAPARRAAKLDAMAALRRE